MPPKVKFNDGSNESGNVKTVERKNNNLLFRKRVQIYFCQSLSLFAVIWGTKPPLIWRHAKFAWQKHMYWRVK